MTTYVLGAGFSKAAAGLPLTDDLGNLLRKKLSTTPVRVPAEFTGGSFETWMSRISEPQPDLSEVDNARNTALFTEATHVLHEVLTSAENDALTQQPAPPEWVIALVRIMHVQRATVATFNYDTLLERAALSSENLSEDGKRLFEAESLYRDLPPVLQRPHGLVLGSEEIPTLTLLKLHGSLNCYWTRGDNSGATLGRAFDASTWGPDGGYQLEQRERSAPGREPFLVPPAAAKSAYYHNPVTRQIWRNTARALRDADQVVIAGYSLPVTDLVTGDMFTDALADTDSYVHVVNPCPEEVAERLVKLGVKEDRITCHGDDCLEKYTQRLAEATSMAVLEELRATDSGARLAVRSSRFQQPITAVHTHGQAVVLTPTDTDLRLPNCAGPGPVHACTVGDLSRAAANGLSLHVAVASDSTGVIRANSLLDHRGNPWVILDVASAGGHTDHPQSGPLTS